MPKIVCAALYDQRKLRCVFGKTFIPVSGEVGYEQRLQQFIIEESAEVEGGALLIGVLGHGGITAPEWMVIMRERRRGVTGDKLHPVVCEGAPAVCGGDADILRVGELVVVNAKAPTKKMWLYVVADFQLFVGEARAESGDQVSAFCHIAVERTEKIVGCGIERRDNEKIIGGKNRASPEETMSNSMFLRYKASASQRITAL